MKKLLLSLLIGSILFSACSKEDFTPVEAPCELQTGNPAGRSYAADSVVSFVCTQKHCGFLPLSTQNYWIYQDSVFTDGVFQKIQYDTLRFLTTEKSLPDDLVWWKGSISIGLPETLYTNESTFFSLADRMFTPGIMDVKKEFGAFEGDSLRYLTSFEDAAALGRSLKTEGTLRTPAGNFDNCFYFEKNARNYRMDQVYFKEGLGVIKYILQKAPMGQRTIKLQQVSTLVAYHIE